MQRKELDESYQIACIRMVFCSYSFKLYYKLELVWKFQFLCYPNNCIMSKAMQMHEYKNALCAKVVTLLRCTWQGDTSQYLYIYTVCHHRTKWCDSTVMVLSIVTGRVAIRTIWYNWWKYLFDGDTCKFKWSNCGRICSFAKPIFKNYCRRS